MPTGHYTNNFSDSNNAGQHGTHVAGIAAGKTFGWAKAVSYTHLTLPTILLV